MHNTIAFCQVGAVTTEEAIDAVADQNARTSGDDHFIGKYNQIISMFAGGKYTQTFRLVSPSLRRNFCPYIHPYLSESTDAYWLVKPVQNPQSPIPLETNEALNAMVVCSQAGDAIHNFVGVSLAEGPVAPVNGDIRTLTIEASVTVTADVWTNHELTFPIDLQVGRYAVVGAQVRSNKNGIFRLVPIGSDFRPGGMMDAGNFKIDTTGQRFGKLGVWCEFDQLTPPSLELCTNVTGSWYSLKLDLMRIS